VDFGWGLIVHAGFMMGFLVVAYRTLQPARKGEKQGLGLDVISMALLLLTLDFLQYAVICSYGELTRQSLPLSYFKYSSLYDLLIEIMLAFGAVMMVMESVRRDLERANNELTAAGTRLQQLAEKDPLTEALNRHAFHALLDQTHASGRLWGRGSVALVDLDDLKTINDTMGHAAGDAAIRAVASAIRSVIRADDFLFRWGGDEFLIVVAGVPDGETRRRLEKLDHLLDSVVLIAGSDPISVAVSCGVAGFEEPAALEAAIERGDREMYLRKQGRKGETKPLVGMDVTAARSV
jgi:diguanylate cyclase (GGDEF)-like protein